MDDMATKAYRVVMGCKTVAQATVALRWLDLAYKADPCLRSAIPFYKAHLSKVILASPFDLDAVQ